MCSGIVKDFNHKFDEGLSVLFFETGKGEFRPEAEESCEQVTLGVKPEGSGGEVVT